MEVSVLNVCLEEVNECSLDIAWSQTHLLNSLMLFVAKKTLSQQKNSHSSCLWIPLLSRPAWEWVRTKTTAFFQCKQVRLECSYAHAGTAECARCSALKYASAQLVSRVVTANKYYVNTKLLIFQCSNSSFPATGRCNQIQCMNGGSCYENGTNESGLARCSCKNGYTGKFCETGS